MNDAQLRVRIPMLDEEFLRAEAERRRITVSELVRRLIAEKRARTRPSNGQK